MKVQLLALTVLFLAIGNNVFAKKKEVIDYKKAIIGNWKAVSASDAKCEKISKKLHKKAGKNEAKIEEAKNFDIWAVEMKKQFEKTDFEFNASMSVVLTHYDANGKTKTEKATYTVEGKQLKITTKDATMVFTIVSIIANHLKLEMDICKLDFGYDRFEKTERKKLIPAKKQ